MRDELTSLSAVPELGCAGCRAATDEGHSGLSPGAHVSEVTSIPPQATAECKGVYICWGPPKVGAIQWLW